MLACVKAGDHLLVVDCGYGQIRRICDNHLKRFGVETTYFDPAIGAGIEALFRPNTRAVFVEAPGSLTFEMQDIPAIADVAHRHDGAGRGGCRTHRGVSAVRVRGVQRTRWPSATATSSGGAALQTGSAWLQRGPKRQPAIASSGSGMRPGIE